MKKEVHVSLVAVYTLSLVNNKIEINKDSIKTRMITCGV